MAFVQQVMSGADAKALGVDTDAADTDVVVVGQNNGVVAWVTILDPGIDPATAINPGYPAEDWQA